MTAPSPTTAPDLRIDIDPDDLGRGFAQVVLAVAELLRELLERQAIRRVDAGDLDDEQIERLGRALLRIKDQIGAVRTALEPTGEERLTESSRPRKD